MRTVSRFNTINILLRFPDHRDKKNTFSYYVFRQEMDQRGVKHSCYRIKGSKGTKIKYAVM